MTVWPSNRLIISTSWELHPIWVNPLRVRCYIEEKPASDRAEWQLFSLQLIKDQNIINFNFRKLNSIFDWMVYKLLRIPTPLKIQHN